MRLFIAVFPPEKILADIRNVIRQLGKIKRNFRFSQYEQMHLTLKFIGSSVSEDSYKHISENFDKLAFDFPKEETYLDQLMFGFSGQQYPNVLFFSVKENDYLNNLVEASHNFVKDLDLEDTIRKKEKIRHESHITIGRSKRSTSKSLTRSTREEISKIEIPESGFVINELSLMESSLSPTGPVYRKISSIHL